MSGRFPRYRYSLVTEMFLRDRGFELWWYPMLQRHPQPVVALGMGGDHRHRNGTGQTCAL